MTTEKGGIAGITGLSTYRIPPGQPAEEVWRYGLGLPLQVSRDQVAIILNIRRDKMPYVDFEAGSDAVVLSGIPDESSPSTELSRNHREHAHGAGELVIVKYPTTGGFIPAGSKLQDGSSHPHAGTGFGIIHAIGFPLTTLDPRKRLRLPEDHYEFAEIQQYRIEGRRLTVERSDRYQPGTLPAGVSHRGTSFTAAVPKGLDLLFGMQNLDGTSGVARWVRGDRGWLPAEFHPVSGAGDSIEPSLIRDNGGSYLFSARGESGDAIHAIRVWGSPDCLDWESMIDDPWMIGRNPVTINRAADGTPYIAANPFLRDRHEPYRYGERGVLNIWPLDSSRRKLKDPISVCDGDKHFGESPSGRGWYIDHPNGQTVRLADGRWRHILVYRVADRGEVSYGTDPVPVTGCHMAEVESRGEVTPSWVF